MRKNLPKLKRPTMIRRTKALRQLVDELRDQPALAVDTESNSLYAYYEQVCLVQLSTRSRDYIIDPLAIDDMSSLGVLFADPSREIVFHAAEYDVISLKRDFGYTFGRIFDTMIAARISGWKAVGLGSILAKQFGVQADKKYQRANWTTRPLPPEQLLYAQMDTHYLLTLCDLLDQELASLGRQEEARETFAQLLDLRPAEYHFDPEGYWRIHATRDLNRSQMALVRELYLMRDTIARQRDAPPFKVFGDSTLVELARLMPRRRDDLHGVKGMTSGQIQRYGEQILEAIVRGRRAAPPTPPQRSSPPAPDVQERYEALHNWRKRRAAKRGVESDVIVSRDTLWRLARRAPTSLEELGDIPGLGPWRQAEYGQELIAVLVQTADRETS
ncbi:MAG: ribonuclease D [Anaerolineae bacterium]|nr:ribonuclease D [Anaerolineae bacterium]